MCILAFHIQHLSVSEIQGDITEKHKLSYENLMQQIICVLISFFSLWQMQILKCYQIDKSKDSHSHILLFKTYNFYSRQENC